MGVDGRLAAVSKDFQKLQHASPALKQDAEIVLTAVSRGLPSRTFFFLAYVDA